MKKWWIASAFVCSSMATMAQNSIMMGKITDSHLKPLPKTKVILRQGKEVAYATADENGLYHTGVVEPGKYTVKVSCAGRNYTSVVALQSEMKMRYHNITIGDKGIKIEASSESPSLENGLDNARKSPAIMSPHGTYLTPQKKLPTEPEVTPRKTGVPAKGHR